MQEPTEVEAGHCPLHGQVSVGQLDPLAFVEGWPHDGALAGSVGGHWAPQRRLLIVPLPRGTLGLLQILLTTGTGVGLPQVDAEGQVLLRAVPLFVLVEQRLQIVIVGEHAGEEGAKDPPQLLQRVAQHGPAPGISATHHTLSGLQKVTVLPRPPFPTLSFIRAPQLTTPGYF